ncbi:hypothetical protein Tco_1422668, partial [Tanacetum coccineum]
MEKKEKEEVKKRKRVEKGKKDEQDKKKIAKRKGKKKVQDDDEDYELEEMQSEKKKLEKEFKSLRAKTTIRGKLPYFVLKILDTKRMEVSFPSGSKLKITPKKMWEVLGIPMGKNKLESHTPREYYDELLKAFKALFNNKKENLEMLKGKIGLLELIEDDDKQDENEKDVEKRKLRE